MVTSFQKTKMVCYPKTFPGQTVTVVVGWRGETNSCCCNSELLSHISWPFGPDLTWLTVSAVSEVAAEMRESGFMEGLSRCILFHDSTITPELWILHSSYKENGNGPNLQACSSEKSKSKLHVCLLWRLFIAMFAFSLFLLCVHLPFVRSPAYLLCMDWAKSAISCYLYSCQAHLPSAV